MDIRLLWMRQRVSREMQHTYLTIGLVSKEEPLHNQAAVDENETKSEQRAAAYEFFKHD